MLAASRLIGKHLHLAGRDVDRAAGSRCPASGSAPASDSAWSRSPEVASNSSRTFGPAEWIRVTTASSAGWPFRVTPTSNSCGRMKTRAACVGVPACSGESEGQRGEMDLAPFQPPVKEVHLAQELHHELGGRLVEHLVGRADLLDPPLVHHQHAVGQFQGLVLVVGDEDAGQMDLVVQPAEPLPQLLADSGVERAERLVQQAAPSARWPAPGPAPRAAAARRKAGADSGGPCPPTAPASSSRITLT